MANIHDVNESLQVQPSVRNLPTLIALSQGENGRSLQFRMVGATIPSGSSASLSGTKPDGVVYSKAGTVDGNTVIFQEDVQLTAVAGAWDAKIHIVNSGDSVATALIRFIIDPDPVAAGAIPSDTQLEGIVAECKLYAEAARSNAYGSPLTASTAAGMIDTAKVYVYTGSETGYTAGHWYYYNGSVWADGGVYNSIAVQTDTTLTLPDHAADAKATGDALATKADKIGNIALAERLYGGEYSAESEPYHFRQAPEGMGAKDETIVGGSLAWNQLVENGNFSYGTIGWKAQNAGSSVSVNNGIMSVTFNSGNANAYNPALSFEIQSSSFVANHAYLISYNIKAPITSRVYLGNYAQSINTPSTQTNTWVAHNFMMKPTELNSSGKLFNYIGLSDPSSLSVGDKLEFQNIHITDLTILFGTTIADYIYSLEQATAGAGVAWVRQYIDLDTYHEYCEPTLKSVEGLVSHDMVGKNRVEGYFPRALAVYGNGVFLGGVDGGAAGTTIYFRCIAGQTYIWSWREGDTHNHIYWGAYDHFPSYGEYTEDVQYNRVTFTPKTTGYGCLYIKNIVDESLVNYQQIELGTTATEYEPYEKHSYPLDSDVVLRGVPKLVTDHIEFDGDKYKSDGTVERRYGVVDLGTLTYVKSSSITNGFVAISGVPDDFPLAPSTLAIPNWLCLGYQIMSNVGIEGSSVDEAMAWRVSGSNKGIIIRDSSYATYYNDNDMASFKTAMSGVYLVYELATPTTETAQPFQSPMIVGATEEYVSDSVVPVGHESRYYEDVAKKVNGLPKDFSTLIAPTEVTFTATRNYSVGSYLIVKNQLYKVTSAISSGGTITPNSNVTATTIMAEILALA